MRAITRGTRFNIDRILRSSAMKMDVLLDRPTFSDTRWISSEWKSGGRRLIVLGISVFSLGIVQPLDAQSRTQTGEPPSLRVHGSATLSAEPTQAQFDIGVVTSGATAKAATDKNTDQSDALVRQLRAEFPDASIKDVNFSVNPVYDYPRSGGPTISGYTANNTVRFLLNDLSKLSAVIDIAIRSGANSINRLSFTIQNESAARASALAAAAHQAQGSAEALAESLNLKLARLLTVDEGQPVIVSPSRELSFEKLQSTTLAPISPGMIDVRADVDLTYEVRPAGVAHPRKPD